MNDRAIPEWCRAILEPDDDQGKRRLLLMQTAFDVIAEAGFEGLRTRAVAARAGVNIATLHYYFPSKQDLVEGLAQFIGAKFVTIHGPRPVPSGCAALDDLRQEFADSQYYVEHEPKMLLVMQELGMRGKRDAVVKKIVDELYSHWRHGIQEMVEEGAKTGVFRADIDKEALCAILMSIFAGIAGMGGGNVGEIAKTTESWILSDEVKAQLNRQEQ